MSDDNNPECPFCDHLWSEHIIEVRAPEPVPFLVDLLLNGGGEAGRFHCPEPECSCEGPWTVGGPIKNMIKREDADDVTTDNAN
jgi:hypothetical protein